MNRALLLVLAAACGSPPSAVERRSSAAVAVSAQPTNPVVDWNQALLRIVRTPGAQPPTMHPTRSFAILHAAIYDAVNSIVRTHTPYLISVSSRGASAEAAAASAGHGILVALYPSFAAQLDAQLQQSLAQVPDGDRKTDGVLVGQ